jgi:carbon storage regulator
MLVLSRKVGQRIVVSKNIEITIVKIRGKSVLLGVSAESHITVTRPEVKCGSKDGNLKLRSRSQSQCDAGFLKSTDLIEQSRFVQSVKK